jgi:HAD superfamily hydrolase (TIGR01490 family)
MMSVPNLALSVADAAEKKIRVAIFDLDRTVTRTGTYSPFLLFAARRLNPLRLALTPLVFMAMAGYKLRLISRKTLKETMHRLILGNAVAHEQIEAVARAFAVHTMSRNIYPQAAALIELERASGAMVVIASAAHAFYLMPLREALGADHAIGTESVVAGPILNSRIKGENCYGLEKRRRIEAFLAGYGHERAATHVRFYSDDFSDLPSFLFADEAIATNPSRKLSQRARRMNWQVIDWRRHTPKYLASNIIRTDRFDSDRNRRAKLQADYHADLGEMNAPVPGMGQLPQTRGSEPIGEDVRTVVATLAVGSLIVAMLIWPIVS